MVDKETFLKVGREFNEKYIWSEDLGGGSYVRAKECLDNGDYEEIWIKCLAETDFNESRAKAMYLQIVAEKIEKRENKEKDELQRMYDKELEESKRTSPRGSDIATMFAGGVIGLLFSYFFTVQDALGGPWITIALMLIPSVIHLISSATFAAVIFQLGRQVFIDYEPYTFTGLSVIALISITVLVVLSRYVF